MLFGYSFGVNPYTSLKTGPTYTILWLMKPKAQTRKDQVAAVHYHAAEPLRWSSTSHRGGSNYLTVTLIVGSISLAE